MQNALPQALCCCLMLVLRYFNYRKENNVIHYVIAVCVMFPEVFAEQLAIVASLRDTEELT